MKPALPACRFCASEALRLAFVRLRRPFYRCAECRGVLQLVVEGQHVADEIATYEEDRFTEGIQASLGDRPDFEKYDGFAARLRPGRLLEIGPGTGHFLAAARERGHAVEGLEITPEHRRYIHERWGIQTHAEPLEAQRLKESSYDSVVSFNCIEHIIDVVPHLQAVWRVLKSGGVAIVSTANADCLLARLPGGYWYNFKVPGHVSIGSAKSYTEAARRAGFGNVRVSYSEYAFETPIGVALAIRDALAERVRSRPPASHASPQIPSDSAPPPISATRRLIRRGMGALSRWDVRLSPAWLTSRTGTSASIQMQMEK